MHSNIFNWYSTKCWVRKPTWNLWLLKIWLDKEPNSSTNKENEDEEQDDENYKLKKIHLSSDILYF